MICLETKTYWPVIAAYKSQSVNDITFTSEIRNVLTFDEILLIEDFNLTPNNSKLYELIVA